ncbi:MAG: hypothetical protein JWO36_5858 [Myxococcales bacterium]|nr:hypothetical protein [Myxococcales bacterium]
MLRIAFCFTAGRVHATPWGRHVNEGAIEWPPSPWRIYRALLATGWNRHDWSAVPADARELLSALIEVRPTYFVEPGVGTAHTRHYMPRLKGSTDRVIDSFLLVPRDRPALVIQWDTDLSVSALALAARLVANLPYLGRAESAVCAELVEAIPRSLVACNSSAVPECARVDLLAPMPGAEFDEWKTRALGAATGGSEPISDKLRAKLDARYPVDAIEALQADTALLQKAGWSQPPGTRWLTYWVPKPQPIARAEHRRQRPMRADTAMFELRADTKRAPLLPLMRDAILRAESIHKCLVSKSHVDARGPSPCFTGCDELRRPLTGHGHASVLPISERGGVDPFARMDHVVVHAPMGFDDAAISALRRTRVTWAANMPDLFLTLIGFGSRTEMPDVVGRGRAWTSRTPFVLPRYLKPRGRNSLRGQIEAEMESRGLPRPAHVEVQLDDGSYTTPEHATQLLAPQRQAVLVSAAEGPTEKLRRLATRWRHFRLARIMGGRPPPSRTALGLRVMFTEDVIGPISLGYGAHFGLGQLVVEGT